MSLKIHLFLIFYWLVNILKKKKNTLCTYCVVLLWRKCTKIGVWTRLQLVCSCSQMCWSTVDSCTMYRTVLNIKTKNLHTFTINMTMFLPFRVSNHCDYYWAELLMMTALWTVVTRAGLATLRQATTRQRATYWCFLRHAQIQNMFAPLCQNRVLNEYLAVWPIEHTNPLPVLF